MNFIKEIQHTDKDDIFLGLRYVEFSPTDLCNRQCVFCPHVDSNIFPNRNVHLTEATVESVVNDLVKHNYQGNILFAGFGEPTLNRNICKLIKIASEHFPVVLISNGDKIFDSDWYTIEDFIDAGVALLDLNIYDNKEQYDRWLPTIKKYGHLININVRLKYEYPIESFFNRGGLILNKTGIDNPCFIPGTKAYIDWDGTLLFCSHDWSKSISFGNVLETPLSTLWRCDELNNIRKKLMYESRAKVGNPCYNCDAGGQHHSDILKTIWMSALK
jgi:radical SAM protein with 4Fe4S-binding SPASM domain